MRFCELKEKDVINICDCKRLGNVADLEFDPKTGCIQALIVYESGKFWGLFGKDCEIIILVELPHKK